MTKKKVTKNEVKKVVKKKEKFHDENWLRQKYEVEKMSINDIAKELVGTATDKWKKVGDAIYYYLQKFGIKMRTSKQARAILKSRKPTAEIHVLSSVPALKKHKEEKSEKK